MEYKNMNNYQVAIDLLQIPVEKRQKIVKEIPVIILNQLAIPDVEDLVIKNLPTSEEYITREGRADDLRTDYEENLIRFLLKVR